MTTAAQILRSIELAVELASHERLDQQESSFAAYLSGALRADGPEAAALAARVYSLGEPAAIGEKAD